MGKIYDLLKKIADNPDDLTDLPTALEKVKEIEENEAALMMKVEQLHESNKKFLRMITVEEPKTTTEPEEEKKPPSLADIAAAIAEKGGK